MTSKGKNAEVEGRVVYCIACISHGKGVCFCEQRKKMTGAYFAGFIRRNYKKIIRQSHNRAGNLFIQDGNLSQNSKAPALEWQKRKTKLLSISPHSPDINPIKNMSNFIDRKLKSDALEQNKCTKHMNSVLPGCRIL